MHLQIAFRLAVTLIASGSGAALAANAALIGAYPPPGL